jgi:sulfate permease, SulP family
MPNLANSPRSTAEAVPSRWPLLRSLASYRPPFLASDLVAGLTLAAIAIPEQMATARLGGFSPQIGFYAFMAGSLGFALFGGSRFLSCGADSTITPIFAGALALLAGSGVVDGGVLAAALAIMVGVALMASGVFRLGWIANLLSLPVTVGFLAGIAAHILISQLPGVLGVPTPSGALPWRVIVLAQEIGDSNPFTAAIGFGVLALMAGFEAISPRLPGALIGLVAATLAVVLLGLEGRGVSTVGVVSGGPPGFAIPQISAAQWIRLVPLGLLVAAVVMVQTAATTRSFPPDPGVSADVDRDFLGVGAGNLLAGIFGAFPVNASPPRTGIVFETGGRSQLAGLFAAVVILALLMFGATLLRHVPEAALGGVLLFVALRIIRVGQIVAIWRQSFGEFVLVVVTAVAIITLPTQQGVAIGIALSLLHGIWSTTRARIIVYERLPGTSIWWPPSPTHPGEHLPDVLVAGFPAPLSFLNADHFRGDLLSAVKASSHKPRLIVLEATGILEIDFTAAQMLRDLIGACRCNGIDLAVARLESGLAQEAVARFHLDDLLGADHIFHSVEEAIGALAAGKIARPV